MSRKILALILSHGRPDSVKTFSALQKHGFTGDIKIVCDDTDKKIEKYRQNFGEKLVVFNKKHYIEKTDSADNFEDYKTVVYARNAGFDIAENLGYRFFVELDDDYRKFAYRLDEKLRFTEESILTLDNIFEAYFDFLESTNSHAVAMAQYGDFIGGNDSNIVRDKGVMKRKVMNVFFLDTRQRFDFLGKMNEDVNASVVHGARGKVFISNPIAAVAQGVTQKHAGGMTESYENSGTYVKSFYTVMMHPSAVKITAMQTERRRLHHTVHWDTAIPKIISADHRKS